MSAPRVAADQDRSILVEDLPEVVMTRICFGLAEQRLVPLEAGRDIGHPDDRPCTPHGSKTTASSPCRAVLSNSHRLLDSRTYGPQRCGEIPVRPLPVLRGCHTIQVSWQSEPFVARVNHERTSTTESAGEESQLEQHIVARPGRFDTTLHGQVVGRQHKDGEVVLHCSVDDALDRGLPRREG